MERQNENGTKSKYFWLYISITLTAVFVFIYIFSLVQEETRLRTEKLQGELREQKVFSEGLLGISEENAELRVLVEDRQKTIEQLRTEIETLKQMNILYDQNLDAFNLLKDAYEMKNTEIFNELLSKINEDLLPAECKTDFDKMKAE